MSENFVKGWCASWEAIAGIVGIVLPWFLLACLICLVAGFVSYILESISRK